MEALRALKLSSYQALRQSSYQANASQPGGPRGALGLLWVPFWVPLCPFRVSLGYLLVPFDLILLSLGVVVPWTGP